MADKHKLSSAARKEAEIHRKAQGQGTRAHKPVGQRARSASLVISKRGPGRAKNSVPKKFKKWMSK